MASILGINDKKNRMIPKELLEEYTLGGKIDVKDFYFAGGSNRTYFNYSNELVESFILKAANKSVMHYPETDAWLYEAIEKYPIKDKDILIIGSEEPCYEGVAIHYGAMATMVEYQKVTSEHEKLKTMTVEEFEPLTTLYDAAISISSVEHSGLGRYGDALDPIGDIKSMRFLHDKLKSGGICFLAVPMGIDQILWNAHRVYGRLRFPMLIDGWEVLDSFGFIDSDYEVDESIKRQNGKNPHREGVSGGAHQPVFVLRKK